MAGPTLTRCAAGAATVLFAFDLIELKREDWRRRQLADRKERLAALLARASGAIRLNEHLDADGELVFEDACRMGLDGIVSKRIDAPYRSGPCQTWLKSKNPESEAVRREREEDWGRHNPWRAVTLTARASSDLDHEYKNKCRAKALNEDRSGADVDEFCEHVLGQLLAFGGPRSMSPSNRRGSP